MWSQEHLREYWYNLVLNKIKKSNLFFAIGSFRISMNTFYHWHFDAFYNFLLLIVRVQSLQLPYRFSNILATLNTIHWTIRQHFFKFLKQNMLSIHILHKHAFQPFFSSPRTNLQNLTSFSPLTHILSSPFSINYG